MAAALPVPAYDWRTIQDAFHAWFSAASGLGVDRVWWTDQNVVETDFPFGTISRLSMSPTGQDATSVSVLIENVDLLDDGALDVRLHAEGWRRLVVSVAAFVDPRGQPEDDAVLRVDTAMARFGLSSVRSALNTAGVSVLSWSASRLVAPGHAVAEVTCLITSAVFEDVVSIQSVRVTSTADSEVDYDQRINNIGSDKVNYTGASSTVIDTEAEVLALLTMGVDVPGHRRFTATAGPGEWLYYVAPVAFGPAVFTYMGFTGGFDLLATANVDGVACNIYRSVHVNLGATTIEVSA